MFTDQNQFRFIDKLHGRIELELYGYQRDTIKRIMNPEWNRHVVCSFRSSGMAIAYFAFAHERMLRGESTLFITSRSRRDSPSFMRIEPINDDVERRIIRNGACDRIKDLLTDGRVDVINYNSPRDEGSLRGIYQKYDYVFILNANEFHYINLLEIIEVSQRKKSTIVINGKPSSRETTSAFYMHYDHAEEVGYKRTTIRFFVHPKFSRKVAMSFIRNYGVEAYRQLFECRI